MTGVRAARPEFLAWPRLLAGASLVYAAMVAWVVARRMTHPYELEFLEGAALDQVGRVARGEPLYAAPTLAYVPLNYTPLYFWLAAMASRLFGPTFTALRSVSVVSTIAAFALLWRMVRRESDATWPAWLSVGLFAALYRLGGAWLDVARADSLQLALLLAFATLLREGTGWRASAAAGALLAAAFLSKQSALVAAAPLALWLAAREPRRAAGAAAATALILGGAVVSLQAASRGWFAYYAFTVPGFHRMESSLAMRFPTRDLVLPLWPSLAVLLLAATLPGAPRDRGRPGFVAALAAGFTGSAWLLRCYRGCYDNVLMPAHAALAIVVPLSLARIARAPGPRARLVSGLACLLVALQLVTLRWDPGRQVPRAADRAAGDRLVSSLRVLGGRPLVASHPYLAMRAGEPGHAHVGPLMDLIRDGNGPRERELLATLRDSLRAHAWDPVVLDDRDWLLPEVVAAGYQPVGRTFHSPEVFWTLTGLRTRPEWLFRAPGPADTASGVPAAPWRPPSLPGAG